MEEYEHGRLTWRAQFWEYCECNCVYEIDDILGYLKREQRCYSLYYTFPITDIL